jgi:hypothetical protein
MRDGMAPRSFRPSPRRKKTPAQAAAAMQQALDDLRKRKHGYRERSLALHGWICGRCAREFDGANLHLLTVHHRDGNHDHNPPDGSNWENLCVDCHDAEHTKNLLADYLAGDERKR